MTAPGSCATETPRLRGIAITTTREKHARQETAADYLYRAFVARDAVARAVAEQAHRIGYPKFKDSVKEEPQE